MILFSIVACILFGMHESNAEVPVESLDYLDDQEPDPSLVNEFWNGKVPVSFEYWKEYARRHHCILNLKPYSKIKTDFSRWEAAGITSDVLHEMDFHGQNLGRASLSQLVDVKNGRVVGGSLREAREFNFLRGTYKFFGNNYDEPVSFIGDFNGTLSRETFRESKCIRKHYENFDRGEVTNTDQSVLSHGFFTNPDSFPIIPRKWPVASNCKLECFADITLPLYYHLSEARRHQPDSIKWEDKLNVVFWRGSSTGGRANPNAYWQNFSRFKLLDFEKSFAEKYPKRIFDASSKVSFYNAPKDIMQYIRMMSNRYIPKRAGLDIIAHPNHHHKIQIDIGFHKILQCDKEICDQLHKLYYIRRSVDFREITKYKYLIVVDGNTWPSRLQEYLKSNSVILYNGIFTDFYNWQLKPWVHYIPFAHDASDLFQVIEWLENNDDEARKISENARKLVTKVASYNQMKCYIGLALLKYESLIKA